MTRNLHINRVILAAVCLLAAACLWAWPGEALAENGKIDAGGGSIEIETSTNDTFTESSGAVNMAFTVKNITGDEISLEAVQNGNGAIVNATATKTTIPKDDEAVVIVNGALDSSGRTGSLIFLFKVQNDVVSVSFDDIKINRTPTATDEPTTEPEEDTEFKLKVSNVDAMGATVPTPSGDYGEEIIVRLPLTCVKGSVYDVKVTPVLDGDVEKFPFDIDLVDYTLSYPGAMSKGSLVEFKYNWRLSEKATVGVKKVDFTVTYRDGFGGELKSGTVSLFVNVEKGLSATAGEDAAASVPKLIIESYRLSSDKIYAGETFDVEFTVRNTSGSENVQNVQIRVKDAAETATVVPASGGSNTVYIDRVEKGENSTQKLSFQTAPDAEAKAYTLTLDFSYESASTNAAHTAAETIAVPILQKIRLKCDDPVVYDEMGWVDQSCSMYVRMYNMGRSTIYNCMVDVEGEGLEMEESYFGGNLNGGATLSADFSIIPSVAGDIEGTIVISYEDVYGEPGEERLPFTLYVEDMSAMEDPMMEEDMMVTVEMEPEPGVSVWVWVALAAAALAAALIALLALRKRRRRRSLEDDI